MKDLLIQKIMPSVSSFVDDVLKLHGEAAEKQKELEAGIARVKKEEEELKAQKIENQTRLNLSLDKVAEEKAKQTELNNQVADEIAKYNKLNQGLEQKLAQAEEYLHSSKIERDVVSSSLENAKKKESEYQAKIALLKDDSDKVEKDKQANIDERKRLEALEKALNKEKEDNAIKANLLNDLDLRLKADRKEVDRLIKRYNLEEKLKG